MKTVEMVLDRKTDYNTPCDQDVEDLCKELREWFTPMKK